MKQILIVIILILKTVIPGFGQDKYLEQGNILLNNGEFEKAEKNFKKGLKSDPTNLIYQCQLGLTFIEQKKYSDAEIILGKILKIDSNNIGAIWYSGIGNFKNGKDEKAIYHFEKALTLLDKNSGQYYSANWFIGKSYSILLRTVGLSFKETDRMFQCYEEYLRLQPNAKDSANIREYVDRKKSRRPTSNVLKWIDL